MELTAARTPGGACLSSPAGPSSSAERVACRNLLLGLEPPATATHHNPFREWIGALIRADVHGWTNPGARLAEAVRHAIRAAHEERDFDRVVDRLHARYGHYHWVHSVPDTALVAAAPTHADGDFTRSVCRAVSGGWDTDSNGATAGSIAALVAGRVPDRWAAPLKNRLATTVVGFDGIGFDTLAQLTAQEAARS